MAATPRKSYRVPEPTLAKIADLAAKWGVIAPATETAVVVEAIDRAHAAEFAAKPKAKTRAAKS